MRSTLRKLRADRGWSQAELAERLSVSRQTVNAIETEKYEPSLTLAFKIARLFRQKIEECFSQIASRIAECLDTARKRGEIPDDTDTGRMAGLLIDCWEGAALRSRLRGNAAPLNAMLNFYFRSAFSR